MKRWIPWLAAAGVLAGLTAVVWVLWLGGGPAEPATLPTTVERAGEAPPIPTLSAPDLPKGGVYAGVVVDAQGRPIAGATVLLVAFDTGESQHASAPAALSTEWDPSQLAILDFRVAGEGRTGTDGRFRVAADAHSAVRYVLAYQAGYMPEGAEVKGPLEGLRILLAEAGQFAGTVIDAATGRPVPGVDVSIYLQQKAPPPPTPGNAGGGGVPVPLHPFAALQRFVAEVLGPRVWGIAPQGDTALHVLTDRDGVFRIGPVGNALQLEFILTHPDYAWVDHDLVDGRVHRTVVEPGQTVSRTFKLSPGNWIEGKVVDADGKGVPDVRIEVEHVVQMHQHWYYRDRKRVAKTAADGTFRVGGLSFGPYTAVLRHPSFGTQFIPQVPENSRGLLWGVRSVGALAGVVEGLEQRPFGTKVEVILETLLEGAVSSEKKTFPLDPQGSFRWSDIPPGRYSVWARAGNRASMPEEIEIRSHEQTLVRFTLGGGGAIDLRIQGSDGRPVDPATATLIQVLPAGERTLGQFVSRGGRLSAEGVRPGPYRLSLAAPGYLTVVTDPFEVPEGGTASIPAIRMPRQAFLRVTKVEGPNRRSPQGTVEITLRDPTDKAFRRVYLLGPDVLGIPVAPGPVAVRAVGSDGTSFERTYEVPDGGRVDVEITLQ